MDHDYLAIGTNFDFFLETETQKSHINFDAFVNGEVSALSGISLAEPHIVGNGITVGCNTSNSYVVSNGAKNELLLTNRANVCNVKSRRRPPFSVILYELNRHGICKINNILYFIIYDDYSSAHRFARLNIETHEALVMTVLMRLMGQDFSEDILRKTLRLSLIYWAKAPNFCYAVNSDALVRLEDGVLDFKTGNFVTKTNSVIIHNLRCRYLNSERTMCPIFDAFVKCVAGGDSELEERIWQVVGYILSPDSSARIAVILQGESGSGKSVLVDFLKSFFYDDDVADISLFELKKRSELKSFVGTHLVIDSELPNQNLTPAVLANLKKLITGDSIKAEHPDFPHKTLDLKWQGKLLLASNYRFRGSDNGLDDSLCRRFVVIPFRFKPEKTDRYLLEKLVNEKDAVFIKAVKAAKDLEANDYHFSGNYALNETVLDESVETYVFDFLRNHCLVEPSQKAATHILYKTFCELYDDIDCTENIFSRSIEACCKRLGYKVNKERLPSISGGNYVHGFSGLGLKFLHPTAK